jgi:CMP-N,N'-diacetyllegionaminic acid synthase
LKVLAIIPARGGSKGIPMKNIHKLKGKPLLFYTINASLTSKEINRTIVSTNHPKIAKVAKKLGAEVIKRPQKLSSDKAKVESTMLHVINFLEKNENYIPDVVILLQNTSPLRTNIDIDNAIKIFKKRNLDSILSVTKSHYFIWKKYNNKIIPINYNPLQRPNRQEMKNEFIENGAIYITKYNSFIKSECRISGKIGIYEMLPQYSIDVDEKLDLIKIEKIMNHYKLMY